MGGPTFPLKPADGEALALYTAQAVRSHLCGLPQDGRPPRPAVLREQGCCFVTLERDGALRGCIGTLEAARPLYRDAARNACRATADPRTPQVRAPEWPALTIRVSVLSRPEPVPADDLGDLMRLLRPYQDGLIVTAGARQATFLPSVWSKLPEPADFLAALLNKGGWTTDRLPEGAVVRRYSASEYHDHSTHAPLV
jgi:uncharacterized protein